MLRIPTNVLKSLALSLGIIVPVAVNAMDSSHSSESAYISSQRGCDTPHTQLTCGYAKRLGSRRIKPKDLIKVIADGLFVEKNVGLHYLKRKINRTALKSVRKKDRLSYRMSLSYHGASIGLRSENRILFWSLRKNAKMFNHSDVLTSVKFEILW